MNIPYSIEGVKKFAEIKKVKFDLSGYSQEEKETIQHISQAINWAVPVFAKQQYPKFIEMYKQLPESDFKKILSIGNSPWDAYGVPIDGEIPKGFPDAKEHASKEKGLYPKGITKEEYETIEDDNYNSIIVREEGKLKIVPNEIAFKNESEEMIKHLSQVKASGKLQEYVDAKIVELQTGKNCDYEWLQNDNRIDFVLGLAIEEYADQFQGVRGLAEGAVYIENKDYTGFKEKIIELIPELEKLAPWKLKQENFKIPILKFVDVVNWAGEFMNFPFTTLACCLPNDEKFKEKHGSVNLVFVNINNILMEGRIFGTLDVFLEDYSKEHVVEMSLKLTAIHELGHATGYSKLENPTKFFGPEYGLLEECRAELFSIWALPTLVERGLISKEEEIAGYVAMFSSMIRGMMNKPVDHSGARNMMFNYFHQKGAITGEEKYKINVEKFREASIEMLAIIGDIRGTGDKERLEEMKKFIVDRRKEIGEKLNHLPSGLGLIFPDLDGNYPEFMAQPNNLSNF